MLRLQQVSWVLLALFCALSIIYLSSAASTPIYRYEILHTYPHDPQAFTQGLIYDQGSLYESTGLRGQSSLRRVALTTGKLLQIHHLPYRYFAEGLTLRDNQLIQITWQEQTGFIYDSQSFQPLGKFTYDTEGWGLTHDDKYLIMSDGSDNIYFLDPLSFVPVKRIQVRDRGQPISKLNELEYVDGQIWANIWGSNCIAKIAPKTGRVTAWINLKGLRSPSLAANPNAVLNGIAYDREQKRLYVTGKLWSELFEIKLIPGLEGQICF
ncbi:glutaminyl-peptide cyclotransferase [Gloeocapsa sp. PCC 73106]|uniref:glutaminyl-peptide cyclotransferase n=1 Tax=Gloeocapsa sp. PCC 73106 TaxID=102232 RepID=UPI0002AC20F1|nr:glutaminyl-peptide cyclotransferase [Gloeocapsa sp. PCC 73106]ELR98661.1 glutamine cyclotransferase [Gloeocapsa sp. PCC 73106]